MRVCILYQISPKIILWKIPNVRASSGNSLDRADDKPLSEPMIPRFFDAHTRHQATIS